jgi:hypothetical protein
MSSSGDGIGGPPYPVPGASARTTCDEVLTLRFDTPDGPIHVRLVCPLAPAPHPNQPHLVKLDPIPGIPDIFVGWWKDGE